MLKAWLFGVLVLLVAQGLWVGSVLANAYVEFLMVLLWISPVAAATLVAYLSPSSKIAMGLSMALAAACLAATFNTAFQLAGVAVDFSGVAGGAALFSVTLLYSAVGAALGSLAGRWFASVKS